MGRVGETHHPPNEQIDSISGRLRETPHAPNDETDSSTGRVEETPHLTNDETDQHIVIIIYPLTAMVVWAPQTIS